MTLSETQTQRDRALACLILAVCLSVTVLLSVFGSKEKLAIETARNAVTLHEGLLRDSARTLQQNQDALKTARAALASFDSAHQQ
jgi:hypothetical protein